MNGKYMWIRLLQCGGIWTLLVYLWASLIEWRSHRQVCPCKECQAYRLLRDAKIAAKALREGK